MYKKLWILRFVKVFAFSFCAASVTHGTTLEDYLALYSSVSKLDAPNLPPAIRESYEEHKRAVQIYENGVSETVMFANALAMREHDKPLFCFPKNFSLDGKKVREIIFKKISAPQNSGKEIFQMPPAVFAVQGLAENFPCNKIE